MKLTIVLAAILIAASIASAQTIIDYRGLEIQSPDPTGAAGLRLQNNFKALADRIGPANLTATAAPTVNDDVDEGYYAGSLWYDTVGGVLYWCADNTDGAASWKDLSTAGGAAAISDAAYAASWDEVTTIAPSKNALYDYLSGLSSVYQAADADLTTWAGVTPSANGRFLVSAENYAAMKTLLAYGTMADQAANSVAITGGAIDGTTLGATTPSTGVFSSLGAGGAVVTDYPITAHQTADSRGLRILGYDDVISSFAEIYVNHLGNAFLASNGSFVISQGTGQTLHLGYASGAAQIQIGQYQTGNALFFASTPSNPAIHIFGMDAGDAKRKFGKLYVSSTGSFDVCSQAGKPLRLIAGGTNITTGAYIDTDGSLNLPNDGQTLKFGAAGAADSCLGFSGTNLEIYSAGKVDLQSPLQITPGSFVVPDDNGDVTIDFPTATTLRLRGKSGGTVRNLTLPITDAALTDGQVLKVSSGTPTWATDTDTLGSIGSVANGDIAIYNSGWTRLAKGTENQVLKMGAELPAWGADNNTTYTGGDGLTLTETDFDLDLKTGGGLEIDTGQLRLSTAEAAATQAGSGATATLDFSANAIIKFTFDNNGGATTFSFTDPPAGSRCLLILIQDADGGETVTWPVAETIYWAGGTAFDPDTTAASRAVVTLVFDGTDYYCTGYDYATP